MNNGKESRIYKNYAHDFMSRYMAECAKPLWMNFSVDFIHDNYDADRERIPFLDNLIAARASCSAGHRECCRCLR